jgi:hypothetical protein
VKELRALLATIGDADDGIEIVVACTWPGHDQGEAPPHREFRITGVVGEMEPNTADDRYVIECDQEF